MNELANSLSVINAAIKTVRVMDIAKKAVVIGATAACCIFAAKYWRNR